MWVRYVIRKYVKLNGQGQGEGEKISTLCMCELLIINCLCCLCGAEQASLDYTESCKDSSAVAAWSLVTGHSSVLEEDT